MSLSLQSALLVKQKTFPYLRKPKVGLLLKAFFSYLQQHKGNPDLQLSTFSALTAADQVAADAACKVYAIYIEKPSGSSTASYFKGTNHASTGSATASDFTLLLPTNNVELILFPDGLAMSAGFTLNSHTSADGSSGSVAADRPNGFVIVGAP